jgi:hypothetical protein
MLNCNRFAHPNTRLELLLLACLFALLDFDWLPIRSNQLFSAILFRFDLFVRSKANTKRNKKQNQKNQSKVALVLELFGCKSTKKRPL